MSDYDELLQDFDRKVSVYASFTEKLRTLIGEILRESGVTVHSVTARMKGRDSFSKKISEVEGKYFRLTDVTDLTGVRIITYFASDVDRVAQAIEQEFVADKENSVDKRTLLDPDRFGYLSLHYVVTLCPERAALSEYRRYAGLKAEIQVRSILQHAWAEIEHDLGYKTALGVPRDIRRQFSRLAGLLEIADSEFSSIRDALDRYEKALPARIESAPEAVLLDKISLKSFINSSRLVSTLDQQITDLAGGPLSEADDVVIEHKVAELHFVGIRSIAQLEEALRSKQEMVLRFAADWLQGTKRGATQTISLLYLAYVLLGESGDVNRAMKFFEELRIGETSEGAKNAAKVIDTYNRLRAK